jgi:NADH-quinone oxidoreductase subunit N
MISPPELFSLLPLVVLGAAPVVLMLAIAIQRSHRLVFFLTLVALAATLATLLVVAAQGNTQVMGLLWMDKFSLFYIGLITSASLAVTLFSYSYLENHESGREEFYLLLLTATLGAAVLITSTHFVPFFLGLEILSISLYALIAYHYRQPNSIESGIKYLILAAVSAAFLLFGMALIYAEANTLAFTPLAAALSNNQGIHSVYLLLGLGLMIVGIGFKLAVVPFHLWTPDVYQGAPAPVTAFVATVSKGSMFALLIRLFQPIDFKLQYGLLVAFGTIAVASMLAGNLLALLQNNVKRILAYSSIAHLGYLLVAFLAGGAMAVNAATFYLVAYFVTTLGTFGIVTVLSTGDRDADQLEDYRGLFYQHPWLAGIFTALLFSLAGIPLTAGFIGKFLLVSAGVGSTLWLLVLVLVIGSAIGLYYYLRVVIMLYLPPTEPASEPMRLPAFSAAGGLALAVLTLLLFGLGIYPTPLLDLIQAAAASLH